MISKKNMKDKIYEKIQSNSCPTLHNILVSYRFFEPVKYVFFFINRKPGATQKSWRIYFQFVVPPLGGLS